jgi:hypothetical protein
MLESMNASGRVIRIAEYAGWFGWATAPVGLTGMADGRWVAWGITGIGETPTLL